MGTRTVRLDDETEKVLKEIVAATGSSVSAAMKKGLLVLRDEVVREARRVPYDVYLVDTGPFVALFDPYGSSTQRVCDAPLS